MKKSWGDLVGLVQYNFSSISFKFSKNPNSVGCKHPNCCFSFFRFDLPSLYAVVFWDMKSATFGLKPFFALFWKVITCHFGPSSFSKLFLIIAQYMLVTIIVIISDVKKVGIMFWSFCSNLRVVFRYCSEKCRT